MEEKDIKEAAFLSVAEAIVSLPNNKKIIRTWTTIQGRDLDNQEVKAWRDAQMAEKENKDCRAKSRICKLINNSFNPPGTPTCWECDFEEDGIDHETNLLIDKMLEGVNDINWKEKLNPFLNYKSSKDYGIIREFILGCFDLEAKREAGVVSQKKPPQFPSEKNPYLNNEGSGSGEKESSTTLPPAIDQASPSRSEEDTILEKKKTVRGWSLAEYTATIDGEDIFLGKMSAQKAKSLFRKKAKGSKKAVLVADRDGNKKEVDHLENHKGRGHSRKISPSTDNNSPRNTQGSGHSRLPFHELRFKGGEIKKFGKIHTSKAKEKAQDVINKIGAEAELWKYVARKKEWFRIDIFRPAESSQENLSFQLETPEDVSEIFSDDNSLMPTTVPNIPNILNVTKDNISRSFYILYSSLEKHPISAHYLDNNQVEQVQQAITVINQILPAKIELIKHDLEISQQQKLINSLLFQFFSFIPKE